MTRLFPTICVPVSSPRPRFFRSALILALSGMTALTVGSRAMASGMGGTSSDLQIMTPPEVMVDAGQPLSFQIVVSKLAGGDCRPGAMDQIRLAWLNLKADASAGDRAGFRRDLKALVHWTRALRHRHWGQHNGNFHGFFDYGACLLSHRKTAPVFSCREGCPAGMTVDRTTGEVAWTPGLNVQSGEYVVTLQATLRRGLFRKTAVALSTTTITVTNEPPVVVETNEPPVVSEVTLSQTPLPIEEFSIPMDNYTHYLPYGVRSVLVTPDSQTQTGLNVLTSAYDVGTEIFVSNPEQGNVLLDGDGGGWVASLGLGNWIVTITDPTDVNGLTAARTTATASSFANGAGSVLTCEASASDLEGDDFSYAFDWAGVSGAAEQTGNSSSYTVLLTDVGQQISCSVTASDALGSSAPVRAANIVTPGYYGPTGGGTGGACDLTLVDPSTDCDAYCGDEASRQDCRAVQSNF